MSTRSIFVASMAVAAAAFLFPRDVHAFCVYNKTRGNTASYYEQVPLSHIKTLGKSYQTRLDAGRNGCCNWRNRDCNPDGNQKSTVDFQVQVTFHSQRVDCFNGSYDALHGNQQQFPRIEAGGWLELVDNPKYDRSKNKYGSDNPPFLVQTYATDGKSMGSYPCPGYQADKPGLMDFL